jgi:hypothetical protein
MPFLIFSSKVFLVSLSLAPIILQEIGLPKIRKKCRGFNAWLAQLESL